VLKHKEVNMELLNGKFEVTFEDNASLRNAWEGAKQAKKYRIKFNETGKYCFIVIYGGSMANIDEKDALNCLLDDALTYEDAKEYGDISQYLVDEFGYEEYVEDTYGYYIKNPALKRIENGLREQYSKACNILHGKAKIIDLLEEFREEYDY
jgi:hypothetical protein